LDFYEKLKKEIMKKMLIEVYQEFQSNKNVSSMPSNQFIRMKQFVEAVNLLELDEILYAEHEENEAHLIQMIFGNYFICKQILLKQFPETNAIEIEYAEYKWKGMPVVEIYLHFKVMTEQLNKMSQPFLTEEQLNQFIECVFINNSSVPDKIRINFGKGEKGFVIKRFYEFYYNSYPFTGEYSKDNLIKMLCDNFQAMEYDKVKELFNGNRCKRNWS
jgi:hypothetical protein